jgi:hypothetical protein
MFFFFLVAKAEEGLGYDAESEEVKRKMETDKSRGRRAGSAHANDARPLESKMAA